MSAALVYPILAALAAFGLGALPFGLWVGKLARGVDVREHGSGNLGATNVYRTLGPALGWTVFALDALKGVAGVTAAALIAGDAFPGGKGGAALLGAVCAVLGHVFTPFAGFHGGRGVATAAGVMFAIAPVASALCCGIFVIAVALSRRISVGSVLAALALPVVLWAVPFAWAGRGAAIVGSLLGLLIVLRHVPNLKRLAAGTEPAFEFRRRSADEPEGPAGGRK